LGERGFDALAADRFGVGYAPNSYDAVIQTPQKPVSAFAELFEAGLVSQGDRGVYDRFRGRLVWPIRDVTGSTIGFGARKLREDDQGPKYLNTPETPVYHKSRVLYGLDLAKRDIAKQRQVVIVEGYTDVMACHLAGITTAVATCGTAFGSDHVTVVRRVWEIQMIRAKQVRARLFSPLTRMKLAKKQRLRALPRNQSLQRRPLLPFHRKVWTPVMFEPSEG
jgi:DNA primase